MEYFLFSAAQMRQVTPKREKFARCFVAGNQCVCKDIKFPATHLFILKSLQV
jgi:hypothetical protein